MKLQTLIEKAESGDVHAQNELGMAYFYGKRGLVEDPKEGVRWLMLAAEKGLAEAQTYVGIIYYVGLGIEQSFEAAFNWWKKAARQRFGLAEYNLGVMYNEGIVVKKNRRTAFRYFMRAAKQGIIAALDVVGRRYWSKSNYVEAFNWCSLAAQAGAAASQYALGKMYENGYGVEKNAEQSFYWYLEAAKQGYVDALFKVGYAYYFGEGTTQDYKESRKWFEKAVRQGDEKSYYFLGVVFLKGWGVRRNYTKAFKYISKAAKDEKDVSAIRLLGNLYEFGRGTKRSYENALCLYRKAAEQQDAFAYYRLGYLYENGKGTQQDFKQAFKYFLKAARLGDAQAMFAVGFYYLGFERVKRINYQKVVQWYIKSFETDGYQGTAQTIGIIYENGGPKLKPDLKEAEKWYEIAKSEKALERVRSKMNTTDNPLAGNRDAE